MQLKNSIESKICIKYNIDALIFHKFSSLSDHSLWIELFFFILNNETCLQCIANLKKKKQNEWVGGIMYVYLWQCSKKIKSLIINVVLWRSLFTLDVLQINRMVQKVCYMQRNLFFFLPLIVIFSHIYPTLLLLRLCSMIHSMYLNF